ncbi:2-hydroxy-3-oxopropionate reductase [bacterium HR26]|nr:2-hydroxy-3-oxopropionate reductase [bacterium HR26]
MRVGVIGLGKMGKPMTRNLLKAGFTVVVHNRSRGPVDELAREGAVAAWSPAEVAQQADVVVTSLPTPASVEEVYLGENGLIGAARPGQVLIDTSTVSPGLSRRLYAAAKERAAGFLDAPVSGGPAGAESATLTIMVGGDAEVVEQAMPVFQALGKNIHHVGPSGAGSVVKLVNQLLVAINMAGVAEAIVFGVKAGADPQVLLDVIKTSFGGSRMLERALPLVMERQFQPGTPVNLILKDLGLIHEVGKELDTRLLLGALAQEVFKEARAAGFGDEDMVALFKPVERLAGVEVRGRGAGAA